MSKPVTAKSSAQAPAPWAQALFAGSLLLAGLAVWLLVTL